MENELGESRFNLSAGELEKIINSRLSAKNCELVDIRYGYNIEFNYKQSPEKKENVNEEKVGQDMTFNGDIKYEQLRQIVFDYYKEKKGIELGSVSIDYLRDKLTGANQMNPSPFFIMRDPKMGETRFDIPKEEMTEILKSYLASKNCELSDLSFERTVKFTYKMDLKHKANSQNMPNKEPEKKLESSDVEEKKENSQNVHLQVEQPTESKKQDSVQQVQTMDPTQELVKMAKEQRKFTILQRERAMSDEAKAKNRSALLAGACLIGACVAVYFNGADVHQVLQHELNAIYSWQGLGQYLADLGPFTTMMAAGVGAFTAKYFKHSKKFKDAQNQFIDMNNSLMQENIQELGGQENAKSR